MPGRRLTDGMLIGDQVPLPKTVAQRPYRTGASTRRRRGDRPSVNREYSAGRMFVVVRLCFPGFVLVGA
jgi:hypothetical protein